MLWRLDGRPTENLSEMRRHKGGIAPARQEVGEDASQQREQHLKGPDPGKGSTCREALTLQLWCWEDGAPSRPGAQRPGLVHYRDPGLPWWLSSKESTCQCRRHVFNPLVKIPWRRKCQPTPVCLPGKSHEQRPGRLHTVHGVVQCSD